MSSTVSYVYVIFGVLLFTDYYMLSYIRMID
jgi:hypothetical protein